MYKASNILFWHHKYFFFSCHLFTWFCYKNIYCSVAAIFYFGLWAELVQLLSLNGYSVDQSNIEVKQLSNLCQHQSNPIYDCTRNYVSCIKQSTKVKASKCITDDLRHMCIKKKEVPKTAQYKTSMKKDC